MEEMNSHQIVSPKNKKINKKYPYDEYNGIYEREREKKRQREKGRRVDEGEWGKLREKLRD